MQHNSDKDWHVLNAAAGPVARGNSLVDIPCMAHTMEQSDLQQEASRP